MTDEERIQRGLTKKLKYRYAYASGDIHSSGESGTYFLRALARMGIYLQKNEKYFTPESVKEIKKKRENPNYPTSLINPIYISDHQVPLEYAEIETIGGEALYDYEEEPPIFLGFAPKTDIKTVIREAEKKLSPPGAKFGLEGGGGTADNTIPQEGSSADIKNLKFTFGIDTTTGSDGRVKVTATINSLGVANTYDFDSLGFITVNGIKYSAVQLLDDTTNITALKYLKDLKDDKVDLLLESWGLEEEGPKEEEPDQEGLPEREPSDDPTDPNDPDAKPDEVAETTNTSSITETISILRGWKVKDGKVVYKKNGKPEKTSDKSPQLSISDSAVIEIGSDGSINITGDVQINGPDKKDTVHIVKDGKFAIKFGKITGNFKCQKIGLISLANAPKTVTGTFDCSKNKLTTLAGGPDSVGIFIAHSNTTLKSLAGGPKIITGITDSSKSQKEHIYDVSSCGLTSLDGNGITTFGPGGFNCGDNKLTALSGLDVVSSAGVTKFDCSKNLLTSLVGIPNSRKDTKTGKPGDYNISGNVDIKTFPASMANLEVDEFRASGLSLTSLSFAPKQVYGNFDCTGNKGSTKLTNQTIGKDRFKIGGGFEEDAGNRIVKIDGSFISPEGSWSDKTYDISTVYKAPPAPIIRGGGAGASGGADRYDDFNFNNGWWGDDKPLPPSRYTVIKAPPSATMLDIAISGFEPGNADIRSKNCDTYYGQSKWGGKYRTFCNMGFFHDTDRCIKTTAFMAINGVYRGTSDGESFYQHLYVTTNNQVGIANGGKEIRKIPLSAIKWTCGGSNKILTGGSARPFGNSHSYATNTRNQNRPRTSIGLTKDNQVIAVITGNNVKWNNWKATLKAAGGWEMINYDGGGSSMATVNGVKKVSSDRPVTTVLTFNI